MWAFRKGCSWWDGGWGGRRVGEVRGGVAGLEVLLGKRGSWPRARLELLPFEDLHPGPRVPSCLLAGLAQGYTTLFFLNGNIWNLPLKLISQFQFLFLQTPEHAASHLLSGLGVISRTWPPA